MASAAQQSIALESNGGATALRNESVRATPLDLKVMPGSVGEISREQAVATLAEMVRLGRSGGSSRPSVARPPSEIAGGGKNPGSPEARLSATQLRYRALIEQVPAVTFMAALDQSEQELYISPQIETLLGFSQQQWLENPFLWYWQLHPDDREKWGVEFARTCSTGVNFRSEYRLIARDGHVVWVQGECQLITDEIGKPLFLLGIAFDITDRKLAEQELQDSNAALEQAIQSEREAHEAMKLAQVALTEINQTLEQRVGERTVELEAAHSELIKIARQAGMAEVATGVLHNVGNVLNSVNVRASLVQEKVKQSRATGLDRVCKALEEHKGDLGTFLSAQGDGRYLPDYLSKLTRHLEGERASMMEDLEILNGHIDHMKRLIASQQSFAKGTTLYEPADVGSLVVDATNINYGLLERNRVAMQHEIPLMPTLLLDRHKVLQILINLIANAAQACTAVERTDRLVRVSVHQPKGTQLEFRVTDNGMGIAPENLTKIFSHGFTTRSDGHGFGLHSCANAAREMGGSLLAASRGTGNGATFTLMVPARKGAAASSESARALS